ncbi:hypothetical protein G4Y79_09195 [Phototrophicus methaneseepsis]|uniref:Two pore domain potassium channel family protein n=1 Tax=Phototrophicus methaneseepsis TaxID=2710758 RepID=A0A7S8ECM6_9CHLR|nr:hypothetical protein [Phototrophicus methaneseepsis]QPC84532.1 hypothetical protein G4Y79_09195 [Phototrophicus methaneseepsis]
MLLLLKILSVLFGILLIIFTLISAIRIFVLPRGENVWLNRIFWQVVYQVFLLRSRRAVSYEERDRLLAYFAPAILLLQPFVYLGLLVLAYTPIYWGLLLDDLHPAVMLNLLYDSFLLSGSSLLTLGYAGVNDVGNMIISFSDAAVGMVIVALFIAYVPTIYSAFSQREKQVAMLEVRAGSPPFGVTILQRVYRNQGSTEYLMKVWTRWEEWFVEIEENHTSLPILVFFRSPTGDRSWVTAAGAVLDAAALLDSCVDEPRTVEAVMCIRAGYLALRHISDYFRIDYDINPKPEGPISISRDEFDEAWQMMVEEGIPMVADVEQAWRNFVGWRVNYDRVLVALARLTGAPFAPWSSDRSLPDMKKILG